MATQRRKVRGAGHLLMRRLRGDEKQADKEEKFLSKLQRLDKKEKGIRKAREKLAGKLEKGKQKAVKLRNKYKKILEKNQKFKQKS